MSYKVQYFSPVFKIWSDSGNIGLNGVVFNNIQEAQEAIKEHGSKTIEYKTVYVDGTVENNRRKLARIKEILGEPSKSERIKAILEEEENL